MTVFVTTSCVADRGTSGQILRRWTQFHIYHLPMDLPCHFRPLFLTLVKCSMMLDSPSPQEPSSSGGFRPFFTCAIQLTSSPSNAVTNFANHKNIAYRFMQPHRLSAAIDLSVTTDPCVFTRIFLMWRGLSDEEMVKFAESGEKEAEAKDWKSVLGFSPESQDTQKFRVLETSIME